MSLETKTRWLLVANALIGWALSLPGIVDPVGSIAFFGGEEPNYSFLVRLWSGFVFLFACLSWEASRDPRGKLALLKYLWIGKAIAAVCVTAGHLAGEASPSLMGLNVLANWLWIPPILYCHIALRRRRRLEGDAGDPAPGPRSKLLDRRTQHGS